MKEIIKNYRESLKTSVVVCAGLVAFLLLGADISSAFILAVCGFVAAMLFMFGFYKKTNLRWYSLIPLGIGLYGAYNGGTLAVTAFLMMVIVLIASVSPAKLEAECPEED